jgi:hypothetical protein
MTQTATSIYSEEIYLVTLQQEIASQEKIEKLGQTITIDNALFGNVIPFFYNDRIRLTFFISEKYKARFALVRGIVEFNRTKAFSFLYNKTEKMVECDISIDELASLQKFLQRVLQWTEQEVAFKKMLKHVIDFENQSKKVSERVYGQWMRLATVQNS